MNQDKREDRRDWATGGGLMMGLGVGFFFLERSPLWFTGCILLGLGLGLIVSAILSSGKKS
jgi:F0F1-type ATP synthase assembly protein I